MTFTIFTHGKCDICRKEGPTAWIKELDRNYCSECLGIIVRLLELCSSPA